MAATIIDQHRVTKSVVASRGLTPVGEMTGREAERAVDGMVNLYRQYKGGTRAEALRCALDNIIKCGQTAPSEAHRIDYRLMYINALDQLRAER